MKKRINKLLYKLVAVPSPGALNYTNSISAEQKPSPNKCPGYDNKQSDGMVLALDIWGMWSTPSLPLLPDPLGHIDMTLSGATTPGKKTVKH